jgi:general secretion pathway protein G
MERTETTLRKGSRPRVRTAHPGPFRFFQTLLRTEGCTFSGFTLLELMVVVAILGALSAISIPMYVGYVHKARMTKCIADIYTMEKLLKLYQHDMGVFPDSLAEIGMQNLLDPWGNPYEYLRIQGTQFDETVEKQTGKPADTGGGNEKGKPRKDRFLHPINNDFDLYSMGPDGKTVAPLTAKASQDDIIRASDGRFVGVAANY